MLDERTTRDSIVGDIHSIRKRPLKLQSSEDTGRFLKMLSHLQCYFAVLSAGILASNAINTEPGRLGCYQDSTDRVWKQWDNTHQKNTARFCRNMCQEFNFAGLQEGSRCLCGDDLPPTKLPDSRCNSPCTGDTQETCGGALTLEVFPVEPKPAMIGRRLGCFQDGTDRVWKTGQIRMQSNSPQRCFNACRGFRYAGLEAGDWCVCGDTLPLKPLSDAQCQVECFGLHGKTCGGRWTLEAFEISETPVPVQVLGRKYLDYQPHGDLGIYKLFVQRKTWHEAWQQCEDDDAHLLIINSEDEATFVRSLFAQVPSETRMHAGFHDLLHKGSYRTLFGEPLSATGYSVWSTQHAQQPSPVQHCGCVDAQAKLAQIDGNCGAQALFVCEKKSDSPDANGHSVDINIRGAIPDSE